MAFLSDSALLDTPKEYDGPGGIEGSSGGGGGRGGGVSGRGGGGGGGNGAVAWDVLGQLREAEERNQALLMALDEKERELVTLR